MSASSSTVNLSSYVLAKNWESDVPVAVDHVFELDFSSEVLFPRGVSDLVFSTLWRVRKSKVCRGRTTVKKSKHGTKLTWRSTGGMTIGPRAGTISVRGLTLKNTSPPSKGEVTYSFKVEGRDCDKPTHSLEDYIDDVSVTGEEKEWTSRTFTIRFKPEVVPTLSTSLLTALFRTLVAQRHDQYIPKGSLTVAGSTIQWKTSTLRGNGNLFLRLDGDYFKSTIDCLFSECTLAFKLTTKGHIGLIVTRIR